MQVKASTGAGGNEVESEPRPDRRKLKGAASRERILVAATELFSTRGYAATGLQEVCRRAGIEKAALYWHFGSKEGLLAAVVDRMDAEFVEHVAKRVSQTASPDDRLDVFIDGLKRLVAERGHLVRLSLSVVLERSSVSSEARDAMQNIFDRTRDAVVRGFESALGASLPDLDLIARLALAYLDEAAVRDVVDPEHVEHDRFFAHLRRLIVLDIAHQVHTSGQPIPAERLPTLG